MLHPVCFFPRLRSALGHIFHFVPSTFSSRGIETVAANQLYSLRRDMLHQLPNKLRSIHHLDVLPEILIVLRVPEDPAVHRVIAKLLQGYRRTRDVFGKTRLRLDVDAFRRIINDWASPSNPEYFQESRLAANFSFMGSISRKRPMSLQRKHSVICSRFRYGR